MWGDITCWTTFSVGGFSVFSVGDITCWTTFSVGEYYLLDYV